MISFYRGFGQASAIKGDLGHVGRNRLTLPATFCKKLGQSRGCVFHPPASLGSISVAMPERTIASKQPWLRNTSRYPSTIKIRPASVPNVCIGLTSFWLRAIQPYGEEHHPGNAPRHRQTRKTETRYQQILRFKLRHVAAPNHFSGFVQLRDVEAGVLCTVFLRLLGKDLLEIHILTHGSEGMQCPRINTAYRIREKPSPETR